MIRLRRCQSQSTINQKLPCGRFQQVFSPNDFRNAHRCIIYHNGKLVRGHIIMTPDDEITKVFPGDKCKRAVVPIHNCDYLAVRNTEAPVNPTALRHADRNSRSWPARSRVKRFILARMRRRNGSQHILTGASASIYHALLTELLECLAVSFEPFALRVRPKRSTNIRSLLPVEPEPAQILIHSLHELGPA